MSLVRSCCYLGMYPKHGDVSGDGIDSLLECPVPRAHEFLVLHPIVAGA
jgi:hypothetical protein